IYKMHAPEGSPSFTSLDDDALKALIREDSECAASLIRKIKQLKLREHAGEVSLADAMLSLRDRHGMELPVYIRYEGTDVRGRVIQRLNDPDKAYGEAIEKRYNPYNNRDPENTQSENFERETLGVLGQGGFQTTGGMFVSLAQAMHREGAYVFEPGEVEQSFDKKGQPQWVDEDAQGTFKGAYSRLLKLVEKSLGSERKYNAIKDVAFGDVEYNAKTENTLVSGKPSPLHEHLMGQAGEAHKTLAKRHMERQAAYLEALKQKLEEKEMGIGEQLAHVRESLESIADATKAKAARKTSKAKAAASESKPRNWRERILEEQAMARTAQETKESSAQL
ncbi:MAG: hypothetical protein ACPG80_06430, partial [Rickettsiales bacterium]